MLGVVVLYTRSNCQIQVLHKDFQITGREKIHPNGSGSECIWFWCSVHISMAFVSARRRFYDPVTNLTYSITIPEFEGCEVRFSNKGWLLVTKSPTSILFFQPFTRTRIQVPDLRQMELRVINVGIWVKVTTTALRSQFILPHSPNPSFTNPVSDGDSLYYLGENGSAYVSKFSQTMKAIHIGWHIERSASRYLGKSRRRFLIWYKEELISVFVDQGRGTHVVKLDKRIGERDYVFEPNHMSGNVHVS
ncbi:hypothetical protein GOBAR_DD27376 [Gossypium barbadense]|nr:hypothetical protein GOBAR_DD27376 [Gossypium barbadense]